MKDQPLSEKKSAREQDRFCLTCGRDLDEYHKPGSAIVFLECGHCRVIWDYYYKRRKSDHGV